MKNGKLKGKNFFDVKNSPTISFKSTKIVQTGPGAIQGTMAFDRKEYGMNSGIPFIKIANHVEVTAEPTKDLDENEMFFRK